MKNRIRKNRCPTKFFLGYSALHLTEDPAVHLSLTPVKHSAPNGGHPPQQGEDIGEGRLEVAYTGQGPSGGGSGPSPVGASIMNRLFGCFNPLYNMIGKNKPADLQTKEGENHFALNFFIQSYYLYRRTRSNFIMHICTCAKYFTFYIFRVLKARSTDFLFHSPHLCILKFPSH